MILSSNILCGTTFLGGNSIGNVFALDLSSSAPTVEPIPLNVQVSGVTITLGWNSVGFTLQSASSIAGPFANVLGATPPYTVVTTNSQQFFRLQAN